MLAPELVAAIVYQHKAFWCARMGQSVKRKRQEDTGRGHIPALLWFILSSKVWTCTAPLNAEPLMMTAFGALAQIGAVFA